VPQRLVVYAPNEWEDVDIVLWRNPIAFYGQSGRLVLDELPGFTAAAETFAGNSVLRGAVRR